MKLFESTRGEISTRYGPLLYLQYINCRYLFTEELQNLPGIIEENVIYAIMNNINGKLYIGQAKSFLGRMILSNLSHKSGYINQCINGGNKYLYNAINKYKSRNFTIFILAECDTSSILNDMESYFINKFRTCIYDSDSHGYNMTYGGEDCSNLHTSSVISRSLSTRNQLYGDNGAGALNTPEAIQKRIQTNIERYGSMTSRLNTKESKLKSFATRIERYGSICGALQREGIQIKANITKLIFSIKEYLTRLNISNLPLTPYNYIKVIGSLRHALDHINSVIKYKYTDPSITKFIEWNDELNSLFDWYESNYDELIQVNKLSSRYSVTLYAIKDRLKLLSDQGLKLTPINYYIACRLSNIPHGSILTHLETIVTGFYGNPSIELMIDWDSSWTSIFKWFDDESNWESLEFYKTIDTKSLLTNKDDLTSTTIEKILEA